MLPSATARQSAKPQESPDYPAILEGRYYKVAAKSQELPRGITAPVTARRLKLERVSGKIQGVAGTTEGIGQRRNDVHYNLNKSLQHRTVDYTQSAPLKPAAVGRVLKVLQHRTAAVWSWHFFLLSQL